MRTMAPSHSNSADARIRRYRGSDIAFRQTPVGHRAESSSMQSMVGMPYEVPVPKSVTRMNQYRPLWVSRPTRRRGRPLVAAYPSCDYRVSSVPII